MLTLLKRFSWFEWFAIVGVIAIGISAIYLMNKYDSLVGTVAVTEDRNKQLQTDLKEEQRSAEISDQVVFDYTLQREWKLSEAQKARVTNTDTYFAVRDATTQKESSDVSESPDPIVLRPTPSPPPPKESVAPVTEPNPAAVAVLARGMFNTYCAAYNDPGTCPP